MGDKVYEVTITLDDYNNLKNIEFMFNDIIEEFKTIISNASINYYKNDLYIDEEFKPILKKYCVCQYLNKLNELKEQEKNYE